MLGKAFEAEHVKEFMLELKEKTPWPYIVMMDNCGIHVCPEMIEFYQQNNIRIMKTLPYRPDTMGIEQFW